MQEQTKQRRAAFEDAWIEIAKLQAEHKYPQAIAQTKTALRSFPRNPSLQEELKQLKREAKTHNLENVAGDYGSVEFDRLSLLKQALEVGSGDSGDGKTALQYPTTKLNHAG